MSDDIHKTHFTVPELPWREKEKMAILLYQATLKLFLNDGLVGFDSAIVQLVRDIIKTNPELIDWVMKYKGE